jgi:hypothetical protein
MKRMLAVATALIMGTATAAHAQPFLVSASVDSLDVTDGAGTFTVSVLAEIGFKATVYLDASVPTLPLAQVLVDPTFINAPYTDVATVTLTLTGPKTGGTHNIIIKGMNGPVTVYDTVAVTIPNRTPWTVFSPDVVRMSFGYAAQQFVLDKKNSIGWLADWDSLKSFDGTTWSAYAWPGEKPGNGNLPRGMTIDSSGVLWVVFRDRIIKRSATSWTIIDTADASTGLTDDMVQAFYAVSGEEYSCIHTTPDGTVWILGRGLTPNSGGHMSLWLLKYSGSTWTMYNRTNSQIPDINFEAEMMTDANGNVWIWSDDNLTRFDGTYWTRYNTSLVIGTDYSTLIAADRNGWVWVRGSNGTIQFNGDSTIIYFPEGESIHHTDTSTTYDPPNWIRSSYLGRRPRALDISPDGETWAGLVLYNGNRLYPGGLARLVDTTWYHYTIENSGLPNNNVQYVSVDDAGNPWILTQDGSLTILDGSLPPGSVFNEPTSSVPLVTRNRSHMGAEHISIIPNPTSAQATLRLQLPVTDHFTVRLVNGLGQQVALLLDEVRSAGDYGINIPMEGLAAGTYFVQVIGGGISETAPLIITE